MQLDFDTCYKAIQSRDARFDGRFYTGVASTGIYCRPVCPAQTPLSRNVHFYPSAAAAEAAGFRACRRCRPDTGPGSPDWNARADLVDRALRLIAEGVMDDGGVKGLAHRLAVSERHLHREFVAEVGAGPLALARTRRAQTARLLIGETDMPLTEIAYAAGFASIRQFNESMRDSFGCSPSELRRDTPAAKDGAGWLTLRLGVRPPFDSEFLLGFLAKRSVTGIEEVAGGRYRRTLCLRHARGAAELEFPAAKEADVPGGGRLLLRLKLEDMRDLGTAVQRCRSLIDLDVDPQAVAEVLSRDPALAPLVAARPGLRVPGTVDAWEIAARAILGQQVSVAGARTLAGRLVVALGEPLAESDGALTHLFPRPVAIVDADLRGLGLPVARAEALRTLATAVSTGTLALDRGAGWGETEAALLALPGVGPWTASYIALRGLGDPDAFPAGDLGLRRAFERLGLPADRESVASRAEGWRPWRAYAAMHLWESLSDPREEAKR